MGRNWTRLSLPLFVTRSIPVVLGGDRAIGIFGENFTSAVRSQLFAAMTAIVR